jgi:hypothetical protein
MFPMQTQAEMHTELEIVKEQQHGTKAVLTMIIEECNTNWKQIVADKEETNDTLRIFRECLARLDQAMDKPKSNQSPRRKIARPTKPPEQTNMSVTENSDDKSFGSIQSHHTPQNNAPRSDVEMKDVAGGN